MPETLRPFIDALSNYGDRAAVQALQQEGTDYWTYEELHHEVHSLAAGLHERLEPDERVALLASPQPAWIALALAAVAAGRPVVPLDVQMDDDELARVLGDCGAGLLVATTTAADRLERLDLDKTPETVLLDVDADDERHWHHLRDEPQGELPEPQPDDETALFYTSGTTGPPKGVPLSHRNLAFQLDRIHEIELLRDDDRLLLPLPLHHVYPFVIGMLLPVSLGLPLVLPHTRTGPQLVRALHDGQVTVLIGVPRLFQALYDGIREQAAAQGRPVETLFEGVRVTSRGLRRAGAAHAGRTLLRPLHERFAPHLRLVASGGSPLDPDLSRRLRDLGWDLAIGYGLTETSPLITWNLPGSFRTGTVGRPLPGVDIRIDPAARPAEDREHEEQDGKEQKHEVGEIQARGPAVFNGYHHLPEKTEEAFTDDGWFRTGDLGFFDEDGFLSITGRVSTLIVTEGGENVQPDDVEEAYAQHPAIREIGVLQRDEQLVGLAVPDRQALREQDGDDAEAAVRKAVDERGGALPSYQRLVDVALTRHPLPRTRLGKLRRHQLEERYETALSGEEEAPAEPVPVQEMDAQDRALIEEHRSARRAWDWLADRFSGEPLEPDSNLRLDLGVDSLEWVNLTLALRRETGVALEEEAIGRIETVRDLLQEVTEAGEADGAGAAPLEAPDEALSERQQAWLEPLSPAQERLARVLFALNRTLMRSVFRLHIEGRKHLPDNGPFILVPNHASYLDPFALAAALDDERMLQTHWGGWTGVVLATPLNRAVSRLAGVVPVDPERAAASSLAFGASVLQRDRVLVWFPEGSRSPDGELQPFLPGIGLLLDHLDVPVVPVHLRGTHAAMPPGSVLPRPYALTVTFGPPLQPGELAEQGDGDERPARITDALHDALAALGE